MARLSYRNDVYNDDDLPFKTNLRKGKRISKSDLHMIQTYFSGSYQAVRVHTDGKVMGFAVTDKYHKYFTYLGECNEILAEAKQGLTYED